MKTLKLLTLILSGIFIASCTKEPVASFEVDKPTVNAGEEVGFTNTSKDGAKFEWKFGDGEQSTEKDPVHVYSTPGTYEVELKVYSDNERKFDVTGTTLTVIQPTYLVVYTYHNNGVLDDCLVEIYETYDDWNYGENVLASGYTNENGIILFSGFESNMGSSDEKLYYISIYKDRGDGFYHNWYIQYSENLYKTNVKKNMINEVDIYGYFSYSEKKTNERAMYGSPG